MAESDGLRRQYLEAMGIQAWELREQPTDRGHDGRQRGSVGRPPAASEVLDSAATQPAASPSASIPATSAEPSATAGSQAVAVLQWPELEARVSGCTACGLHEARTNTVFGVGSRQARWVVIGEAPGADEDRQGEPFVGRAGKLLNEMLRACGLQREDVYIANILKCRPPRNRDPRPEEVAQCEPYLRRQLELIKPELILAVGRIAAQNLLETTTPIGKLRGRVHQFGVPSIPLVVTYHPAYLLRSPLEKRRAWRDLCFAMEVSAGRR
jgi:DNA polymerase